MRHAPGVGLAAPQLGEPLRACVIEVEDTLYELVNPQIVRAHGDDRDLEGCLSIPGYVAYVTRHEKVWVVAQNRQGKKVKVAGSGLLGRALQHELDHLDGKLYIDYLDSMDELIAVGPGRRGRRRGPRGDERPGVSARPGPPDDGRVRAVFLGSGSFAVPALGGSSTTRASGSWRSSRAAAEARRPRPGMGASRRSTRSRAPQDLHPILTPPRLRHPGGDRGDPRAPPRASRSSPTTARSCPPALLDLPPRRAQPPPVAAAPVPRRRAGPGRDPGRRRRRRPSR